MRSKALDCKERQHLSRCPKCGRSVPDWCGDTPPETPVLQEIIEQRATEEAPETPDLELPAPAIKHDKYIVRTRSKRRR